MIFSDSATCVAGSSTLVPGVDFFFTCFAKLERLLSLEVAKFREVGGAAGVAFFGAISASNYTI